jgi:hypothetical protein
MKNKKIINEDITRIHEIMGISGKLLTEQPIQLIPKPLIKNLLKMSDDVLEPLTKLFNLTDNQIDDVIRRIDIDGFDNISDDVLELLSKSTIDNVDDLVKFMKAGKFFGSNFDEIAVKIFNKVDTLSQIDMVTRKKVIGIYEDSLDKLPFLDGADEIKSKLVRDFKSEFDSKYSKIINKNITSNLDNAVDDLLKSASVVDDIPTDAVSKTTKEMVARNEKAYKEFIKNARKKGSLLKDISDTEYNKLMSDAISSSRRIDPDMLTELKRVNEINPSWWSKQPVWRKLLTFISVIGLGPSLGALLWYSTLARFNNWGDIAWIKQIFSNATGEIGELTQSNVRDHLINTYPIDEPSFNDEFKIYISQDGKSARVRGPRNYTITLTDGKISSN